MLENMNIPCSVVSQLLGQPIRWCHLGNTLSEPLPVHSLPALQQ